MTWKSIAGAARITPVSPPNRNVTRNPPANSIGVWKLIWPRHMVPIQLKNFSPVGIAIRKLMKLKNGSSTAPVANMWCAHTAEDSAAMAMWRTPCPGSRTPVSGRTPG